MSLHPSSLTIFKDLKPEDILQGEDLEFFRDIVLRQIGRTLAYAITGYADWLAYTCIRYIEGGGIPDLSNIEKAVVWPEDINYDTKKIVIDNIYCIIQEIVINSQHYKYVPDFNTDIGAAIDFMLEHCKDLDWDVLSRSMKVLEKRFDSENKSL